MYVTSLDFAGQIIHSHTTLLKHPLSSFWCSLENGQYQKGDNGAAENVEDGTLGELLKGASTGTVTQESNLVVVEIKHARAL